jgi:hypothetical protein
VVVICLSDKDDPIKNGGQDRYNPGDTQGRNKSYSSVPAKSTVSWRSNKRRVGDVSQPRHSLTERLEEVNSGMCNLLSACEQRRELDSSPAGPLTAGPLFKKVGTMGR